MAASSDDLIGVPRATAARVIAVSERRLRDWQHAGLVFPSSSAALRSRSIVTYSLEDLVQGLVVRELLDRGVSIIAIRRIVEAVRSSVHPAPLASLCWATDAGHVYVGFPDDSWVGGRHPNQGVFPEVIDLDVIRADARRRVRRPVSEAGQSENRRGALGSASVFAGTRIPVASVQGYLRAGHTTERILAAYPDLTEQDVELARRSLAAAS